MTDSNVRIRLLRHRWFKPLRQYEVEEAEGLGVVQLHRGDVVRLLETSLGIGEAWSMVHAADERAKVAPGEWVSLIEDPGSRPCGS